MTFIRTIPEEEATGTLKEIYDKDVAANGYVPNFTRALSLRPEVYVAWRQLIAGIRRDLDERRYELITIAAASRLRCSY